MSQSLLRAEGESERGYVYVHTVEKDSNDARMHTEGTRRKISVRYQVAGSDKDHIPGPSSHAVRRPCVASCQQFSILCPPCVVFFFTRFGPCRQP